MPVTVTLNQAVDQILTAIRDRLVAATAPGGLLEDAATVVLGDRERLRPTLPALWVAAQEATATGQTVGAQESWVLPVALVALVQSDSTEQAYRLAGSLAARARQEILAERQLGLPFVRDTASAGFRPAQERQVDSRRLYTAAATIRVQLTVYEQ